MPPFLEVVNESWRVELRQELHECRTADGMTLVMTRKRPAEPSHGAPVLLVHGLGQNRYSWQLSRRNFAAYLATNGYDVFNLELRGHGLSRQYGSRYPRRFEDYLDGDLPAALDRIGELNLGQKPFLFGHSLGGSLAYAAAPKYQSRLAGIVSIAGPVLFGRGVRYFTVLPKLLQAGHNLSLLRFLHGPVPIDLLGYGVKQALPYLDRPGTGFPFGIWYPGSIERDVLLERILKGFDRTSLEVVRLMMRWAATGKFMSTEGDVDYLDGMRRATLPFLFVAGDRDDVVPPGSIRPGYAHLGSPDKTFMVFGKKHNEVHWGHCDLIFGRLAPRHVWPAILDWLEVRRGPR